MLNFKLRKPYVQPHGTWPTNHLPRGSISIATSHGEVRVFSG